MRYSKWLFYALLLLSYTSFMMPVNDIPGPGINDKFIHASMFFVLALLASISHSSAPKLKLFIYLACYGLFTEISQGLVPYRELSIADFIADTIGLSCGLLVLQLLDYCYPQLTEESTK